MENITTTTTTTHCRVVLQILYLLIGLIFILHCSLAVAETNGQGTITLKTYIVFVEKPPKNAAGLSRQSEDLNDWYKSFLPKAITTSSNHQHPRMVRTYKNVVTGFAARLTEEEVKAMAKMEGFLSAHVENKFPLHTTHTPKFLGLSQGVGFWNESNYGKGVTIGVLDTGISPEHISLSDEGMPSPPAKWKGICDFNAGVCNNKLIGARNFLTGDNLQPKDQEGHGTHTATTAAGGFVKDADAFGDANGTAVGMAPLAHLAIYKVCDAYGCLENDMLAAMDAAVEDGVDVLSLSLGAGSLPYYQDGIAVGAFRAMQKGIFVSCSAGNEGPDGSTLSNEAPWILTVGASTIDRAIRATAKLGNGDEYDGESLFQPQDFNSTSLLPLVYAGSSTANPMSRYCAAGSLQSVDVKGKIVLCESGGNDVYTLDKGDEVERAGGAGMILMNQEKEGFSILADPHAVPATRVSYDAGTKIKAYINSITQPVATILFKGTVFGDSYAPAVTYFSSRGPSKVSPGILKPDIIGPGVNILAAWPFPVDNTNSKQPFNIISGTSMSCPHLSGIAALLKSSHPNWSPAAIKSAIMTTADVVNHDDKPIVDEQLSPADIFATGAGHVNPSKANHPGLVYDLEPEDYVPYLCGLNYTDSQIRLITQGSVSCSGVKTIPEAQLNYPSFSVDLRKKKLSYTRRVTNVGQANSTYNVEISAPPGIELSVTPETLVFTEINQKATYTVEFIPHGDGKTYGKHYSQGYIRWVSGNYSVRSPISVQITSYSDSSYTTKVSLYVHIFSLFIVIVGLLS